MKALTRNTKNRESILILYDGFSTLSFGRSDSTIFIPSSKCGHMGKDDYINGKFSKKFNGCFSKNVWYLKSFKNIEKEYIYIKNCKYFHGNIRFLKEVLNEALKNPLVSIQDLNKEIVHFLRQNAFQKGNKKVLGIIDENNKMNLILGDKIYPLLSKRNITHDRRLMNGRKRGLNHFFTKHILDSFIIQKGLKIKL